nr:MFS transporter [uncultured Allomuricauda sp.]
MTQATNKQSVPIGQKLAFGVGMLANQMFPAALQIFMMVLVKGLGFPPLLWGIIFFAPRIFDAFTDPIMGFISDNTRSKWGRRRHYVFAGSIIMGIAFIAMWQLYPENGLLYNFTYFMVFSFIFYLGLTIFSVPYVAMGYEMSDDFHERTNIMAVAQMIGQWAWVIVPWFWIILYDPEMFESVPAATRKLSYYVAAFCTVLALVPAIFIKSESTLDRVDFTPINKSNISNNLKKILASFKEAFRIPQFKILCSATFLIYNSFMTISAFSFFIIVSYMFNGDAGAAGIWPTLHGSVGALVTTFLVIPVIDAISKKMGKKKTFMLSQGISIIGYILFWFLFIPGKPYMFLIALPFFSFGIGGLFTLMMSMTADVIDLDELNTGQRREGIFGAIYWWMVKFGFAIAGLLSGLFMAWVGYTPDAPTQPDGAITGMRLFYTFFPILGTIGAMLIMRKYDITEERANAVVVELEKRRNETT